MTQRDNAYYAAKRIAAKKSKKTISAEDLDRIEQAIRGLDPDDHEALAEVKDRLTSLHEALKASGREAATPTSQFDKPTTEELEEWVATPEAHASSPGTTPQAHAAAEPEEPTETVLGVKVTQSQLTQAARESATKRVKADMAKQYGFEAKALNDRMDKLRRDMTGYRTAASTHGDNPEFVVESLARADKAKTEANKLEREFNARWDDSMVQERLDREVKRRMASIETDANPGAWESSDPRYPGRYDTMRAHGLREEAARQAIERPVQVQKLNDAELRAARIVLGLRNATEGARAAYEQDLDRMRPDWRAAYERFHKGGAAR
jgi:hypothetical protein